MTTTPSHLKFDGSARRVTEKQEGGNELQAIHELSNCITALKRHREHWAMTRNPNVLPSDNQCEAIIKSLERTSDVLKLGQGRRMESINNTHNLFTALVAELPESSVWTAFTFTKSKLVEILMVEKLMSKTEAETWVAERVKPYVIEGRTDGSLEEI